MTHDDCMLMTRITRKTEMMNKTAKERRPEPKKFAWINYHGWYDENGKWQRGKRGYKVQNFTLSFF